MKNTPEKIYLHIGFDPSPEDDFKELRQVTWNSKQVSDTDIPYIREPENGGWISVETPPPLNEPVLLLNRCGILIDQIGIGTYALTHDRIKEKYTHWQALPQPPIK